MYSYFECRGGKYPQTVFFGLQYIIKVIFKSIVSEQGIWMKENCMKHEPLSLQLSTLSCLSCGQWYSHESYPDV